MLYLTWEHKIEDIYTATFDKDNYSHYQYDLTQHLRAAFLIKHFFINSLLDTNQCLGVSVRILHQCHQLKNIKQQMNRLNITEVCETRWTNNGNVFDNRLSIICTLREREIKEQ